MLVIDYDAGDGATYLDPSFVVAGGAGGGGAIALSGTAAGDLILYAQTNGNTTIPGTGPSGYTALGSGIASDESSTDCALRVWAKFATATNEGVPSGGDGASRAAAVAIRGVDPAYLGSPNFLYGNTSGASWVVPGLTLARPMKVMTFGRRGGAADTLFTDLTQLILVQSASSPLHAYWTPAAVNSFAGYSYAMTASVARAAVSIALPGAPA